MRLARQIEGIQAEPGHRLALVGVEFDLQTHPGAVVHPDVTATGGHQLANLGLGQVDALHVDDDPQVEPVDVLADDLEADGRSDGVGEDRLQSEVDVEFDARGHRLDPIGEFFGELLGDAGLERQQFLVIGEAHFVEDGGHRIECLAGETEELFAFDGLLFGQFPAVLGEAFGAAALGFDGGDVDDEVLGLGGGQASHEFHLELRFEFEVDDTFLERFRQRCADLAEEFHAFQRVDDAFGDEVTRHDVGFLEPPGRAGEDCFVRLIEFLAAG